MIEYHKCWAAEPYTSPEVCWIEDSVVGYERDILCEDIPEGVEIIEHK